MRVRIRRRWVAVVVPLVMAAAMAGSIANVHPEPSSHVQLDYSAYGPIGFHPGDTPIIKG